MQSRHSPIGSIWGWKAWYADLDFWISANFIHVLREFLDNLFGSLTIGFRYTSVDDSPYKTLWLRERLERLFGFKSFWTTAKLSKVKSLYKINKLFLTCWNRLYKSVCKKISLKLVAIYNKQVFSSAFLPLIKKAPFGSAVTEATSASEVQNDTKEHLLWQMNIKKLFLSK